MAKRKAKEMEDASASAECTICLSNDSLDIGTLGCKHAFCFECIENWSEHENSCPLCKKRFTYIDRITKEPNGAESGKNKPPTKTRVKIKKKNQLDHPSQAAPPQYPSYGIAPSAFANMASFFSGLTGSRFRYPHDVAFNAFSGMGGFMQAEEEFGRRSVTTGRMSGGSRTMTTARRSSTAPSRSRGGMAIGANNSANRGSSEPIEISDDEVIPRAASSSSSSAQPNTTARSQAGSSTEVIDLTDDTVEFIPSSSSGLQRSSTFGSAAQLSTQPSAHPALQPFAQFPSLPPVPSAGASVQELHSYLEMLEDEFDDDYEPSLRSEDMMSYQGEGDDDGDGEESGDPGNDFAEQEDDDHSDLTSDNEQLAPMSRVYSIGYGNTAGTGNITKATEVIDLMDDDEDGFEIMAPAPHRTTQSTAQADAAQSSGAQACAPPVSEQAVPSVADAASRSVGAAVRPYAGVMVWCRSCESYHDKQRVWEYEGYCRATFNSLLSSGGFSDTLVESGAAAPVSSSSSAQAKEESRSSGLHLLAESAAGETASVPTSSRLEPTSASASVSAVNAADGLVDLMETSDDESYDFLADTQFKRIRRGKRDSTMAASVCVSSTLPSASSEGVPTAETSVNPEPAETVQVQENTESAPESTLSRTQSDATTTSSRSRSQASATSTASSCANPDSACDGTPLFSASTGAENIKRTASFAMSESVLEDSPAQHTRRRTGSFCESESPLVSV